MPPIAPGTGSRADGQKKGLSPKVLAGAGGVVVVVAVVLALVLTRGGGGSGGTSLAHEQGSLSILNVAAAPSKEPDAKARWHASCMGCAVYADDSRVYAVEDDRGDTTVIAYSKNGDKQWEKSLDGTVENAALLGDRLVITTSEVGDGSTTSVLSTSNGDEAWNQSGSLSSVGDTSTVLLSDDDDLVAYDLSSGKKKWSANGYGRAVCNGFALVVDDDSLATYAMSDGKKGLSLTVDNPGGVTCSDAGVFVLDDGDVDAYGFTDSKKHWSESFRQVADLDAVSGLVFVKVGGKVSALKADSGKQAWKGDLDVGASDYLSVVSFGSDRLVVSASEGRSRLVKRSDGEKLGSISDDSYWVPVRGGLVTVSGTRVQLLGGSDLESKWSFRPDEIDEDSDEDAIAGVAAGGGQVYITSGEDLYAYR